MSSSRKQWPTVCWRRRNLTFSSSLLLFTGLRLIPKLGRRKVLVNGKPCGRNELIGIYIERKTGQARNRKQVSSHIQVLKQSRKGDAEFFELIAEPVHEAQFFMPAGGVSYVQTLAGYGYSGLAANGESGTFDEEFVEGDGDSSLEASPHNGGQSLVNSPYLNKSPLPDGAGSMAPPPPRSAGLSSALEKLHLPNQGARSGSTSPASCPILPATFAMWAHCSDNDAKHVYTLMDRNIMASYSGGRFSAGSTPSLPTIPLDSVRVSAYRFPGLSAMYRRLPCRFLHVHVPLSIPRLSSNGRHFNQFSTQLSLTSKEKERLVSVTSVYSHGGRVLSLVEPLGEPRRIAGAGGSSRLADQASANAQEGGANTPLESLSPWVGGSPLPDGNGSNLRHRYVHQAPFATDFWADLLSRTHPVHIHEPDANHRPAFSKEPSERAALGMAVSGVTLIQEFIVRDDSNGGSEFFSRPHVMSEEDASSKVSPGSSIGNVVLVIAWDLECVEALKGQPGVPTVSVLELPMEQMSQQKRNSVGASPTTGNSSLPDSSNRYPIPKMKLITLNKPPGFSAKANRPTPPKKIVPLPTLPSVSSSTSASKSSKPVTPRMGDVPTLAHTAPTPEQQLGKARRTSEAHAHAIPARSTSPAASSGSRSPSPQRPTLSSSSSGNSITLQPPSSGSLARKRGVSIEKRLTVSIPPPPSYLANGGSTHLRGGGSSSDGGGSQGVSPVARISPGQETSPALVSAASSHNPVAWGQMQQRAMHTPITPFPQVSQTPNAPPPLVAHDEAKAQRERLARKWAQETGADLKSPLDVNFNGVGVPSSSMGSYENGGMEYQLQGHSFPQHPSSMAMTPGTGGGMPLHLQQQQQNSNEHGLLAPNSSSQQSIEGSLLSPVGFQTDQPQNHPSSGSNVYPNLYHQRQISNPMHNGFEMGLNFGAGFGMQMTGNNDIQMDGSNLSSQQDAFSQSNPQEPDDFMDQLYTHLQHISNE